MQARACALRERAVDSLGIHGLGEGRLRGQIGCHQLIDRFQLEKRA